MMDGFDVFQYNKVDQEDDRQNYESKNKKSRDKLN
jgi:hypothetical protein